MKVKFLKTLDSALGHFDEGETYHLPFDDYTINNWIETGYCAEVKKKVVVKNENKSSSSK